MPKDSWPQSYSKSDMYLFWRFIYWIIDTKLFLIVTTFPLLIVKRLGSETFALKLLGKLSYFYRRIFLGLPRNTIMYFNLDFSRFWSRFEQRVRRFDWTPQKQINIARERPLKLGMIGPFSFLYHFPRRLFEGLPENIELYIFETRQKKLNLVPSTYLESIAYDYNLIDFETRQYKILDKEQRILFRKQLVEAANMINSKELDLLLLTQNNLEYYYLLDLVNTPCIAEMCMKSDLIHHEKVNFHIFPQPVADYFFKGNRLFNGMSRTFFGEKPIYPGTFLYDFRGTDVLEEVAWENRKPLIFYHGLLYKMASPSYLDCVFQIMADDSDLEFVIMGRDDNDSLSMIHNFASRHNVKGRVHYEGFFNAMRESDGKNRDPGWQKLFSFLSHARLVPNSWPIGGGATRFEAYMTGTPLVHMQVRFDPDSWGKPQHAILEISGLHVPLGSAESTADYQELCRKCLYDSKFANQLIEKQHEVANKISTPPKWWQHFLDCYEDWLVKASPR